MSEKYLKRTIGQHTMYCGDMRDVLPMLSDVDACVTDPPYGLSFMSKKWDYDVPSGDMWQLVRESLKPGAHVLSFGGSRTYHRMAVEVEDGGFEIRDQIMWLYGSGFPKSKAQLKPAHEPIVMARNPFRGSAVKCNAEHGTAMLDIDGCRVGSEVRANAPDGNKPGGNSLNMAVVGMPSNVEPRTAVGRWPANVIHDGSDEVVAEFPETTSRRASVGSGKGHAENASGIASTGKVASCFADSGTAARFFYCAKASKSERGADNKHPTVKPQKLMRYLCKLVTPADGIILDPFAGSGSTGVAAHAEDFRFIGIEQNPEYFEIACARLERELSNGRLN